MTTLSRHRSDDDPHQGRGVWRGYRHLLVGLPVGVLGFGYATTMLCASLPLVTTVVGLPLLAVALLGARGLGAVERLRARADLGLDVPEPGPAPVRAGGWGRIGTVLGDGAAWRAMLYLLLLLPWSMFTSVLTTCWLFVGMSTAAYPAYQWVYPTYAHEPGIQILDDGSRQYYLSHGWQIAACCVLGLLLLALWPRLVRGLARVDAAMVRGLLGGRVRQDPPGADRAEALLSHA